MLVVAFEAPREVVTLAPPAVAVVGTDTEKLATIAPAGMKTLTGTVRDVVLLAIATMTPPAVAAAVRLTVHVPPPPTTNREAEHVSPFNDNAPDTLSCTLLLTEPARAVRVAPPVPPMGVVAVNCPDVAPAGIRTDPESAQPSRRTSTQHLREQTERCSLVPCKMMFHQAPAS